MMHKLLQRQLKKIGYFTNSLENRQLNEVLSFVNQTYLDNDKERELLENTINISSDEMQELYERLERKSELQLKFSKQKYTRLLNNINKHYYFYEYDLDGRFSYISDSMSEILGYEKEEFSKNYHAYLTKDSINQQAHTYQQSLLEGIEQEPYKISIYDKQHNIKYFELSEIFVDDQISNTQYIEGIAKDITEQYKKEKKISYLAKHDSLTGLENRASFEQNLKNLIRESTRKKDKFALLFLDLDRFKYINDTFGHNIGDEVLLGISTRISPNIRAEDIFARIGGDEFIIVLSDIDDTYLSNIINKITTMMKKPWQIHNLKLDVSASIGISLFPKDGCTIEELIKKADIAMYKAKEKGRDTFSFFTDEINDKIHKELQLTKDIKQVSAIKNFHIYYHSQQDIKTDKIVNTIALLRWNHPKYGLLYPDDFIIICENNDFIFELGLLVLDDVCNTISQLQIPISIIISNKQLLEYDLCKSIKDKIYHYQIKANLLTIEIDEQILLETKAIDKLKDISNLGVKITISNFGIHSLPINILTNIPIDTIKIESFFVDKISKHKNKTSCDIILSIAKTLGIKVVAVGVEKLYQKEILQNKGCLYYQGFLFSEPIKKEDYIHLLEKNKDK
jgi:diguanylate cyclase (GGDEF)-like protein/PAS domain S-box-containing protein